MKTLKTIARFGDLFILLAPVIIGLGVVVFVVSKLL